MDQKKDFVFRTVYQLAMYGQLALIPTGEQRQEITDLSLNDYVTDFWDAKQNRVNDVLFFRGVSENVMFGFLSSERYFEYLDLGLTEDTGYDIMKKKIEDDHYDETCIAHFLKTFNYGVMRRALGNSKGNVIDPLQYIMATAFTVQSTGIERLAQEYEMVKTHLKSHPPKKGKKKYEKASELLQDHDFGKLKRLAEEVDEMYWRIRRNDRMFVQEVQPVLDFFFPPVIMREAIRFYNEFHSRVKSYDLLNQ